MDVSQTSPGGTASNPPTTTTTQPVPPAQGQYLGRDVTSPAGSLSTPGMAPVSPHASATVAPSTLPLSPARVSALSEASKTHTGRQGISVVVNKTHVIVDDAEGKNLYTVAKKDTKKKPLISYLNLAALAICQQPDRKANIEQIVSWVKNKIPYFTEMDDTHTRFRIASTLNDNRREFKTETKRSGKNQVKFWALKDEEKYFESAGICPTSLAKRNLTKYSSDCPPAIASTLSATSDSGSSAIQQGVSVNIGGTDILVKGADGETLYTVTKGSVVAPPSTTPSCLAALAICDHKNKKATAREIVSWVKRHIPFYANRNYESLRSTIFRYVSTDTFKKSPYSDTLDRPHFWQLVDETAYFEGIKERPASPESQPPAAKKSRFQPESEGSAGTLSISDVPMPPPYSFAGGSLTVSQQPERAYPEPAIPSPYQPARPEAYLRPPPLYPFPERDPVSDPLPFLGTADPLLSAASVGFPYGQESSSFTDSSFSPYDPPVVVTTTNS